MANILVVDDEQEICEILEDFLTEMGHEVTTATRGAQALESVKNDRPHLMILDIRMPEMDGIQVMKEAKALNPELGVIMVSAVRDEEVAKQAMGEGAYDYITKPIDLDYLRTSVTTKITDTLG